jgi:hypothetical protein
MTDLVRLLLNGHCAVCGQDFYAASAASRLDWTIHRATSLSRDVVAESCGPEHAAIVESRRNTDGVLAIQSEVENVARLIASMAVTASWSVAHDNNTVTITTSDDRVFRCTVEEVFR